MVRACSLLKAWRVSKGLTITAAAELLEVSTTAWWDWENGAVPRLTIALRIAKTTEGEVPVEAWAEQPTAGAA